MTNRMRQAFAATVLLIAVAHAAPSEDAKFRAITTAEWNWREAQFADNEDGAKPIVGYLPHVDPASQAMRLRTWQAVMKQLGTIDRAKLSPAMQVNYDVYKPQLRDLIAGQEFRDYEMPANSDSAFWTDLDYTARGRFKSPADYQGWIGQLRDIPRYFREEISEMRAGEARGFTPPRAMLTGRDAALKAVIAAKPEDTAFYIPFKVLPASIPTAEQAKLRAEALLAIANDAQPAYRALLAFWDDEYVPHARTTIAADDLPNGKAWYRAQILRYTTLDMTPEAIHALGVAQVAALHAQMIAAMKQIGWKGDFASFLNYLRSDPRFYAKSPHELLADAAYIAKRFDGVASRYFGRLPRARFGIEPVPADMAPFYTSGRGGPGVFLVNTYDLAHRPLYNLTALTLHESAPGHALQMSLAEEDKSLPDFRRYTYISAYGEGWAVYCEWLGDEMGMYETPYDRFGMLGWQIWRAARLVVDTGIHTQGWSRAEAVQYLHEYTTLPDHEIETEVDRYITWPGQALSYYIGAMDIRRDRERAEKALGAKFNLRAFHDTVLSLGSVPLPVLDARIDRFIEEGGKGPYPEEE